MMPRVPKPFVTPRRNDAKTYQITINSASGLPDRVCQQWKRRSFQELPIELAQFRNPKTKAAAQAGAFALIEFLKKADEPVRVPTDLITVGAWMEKFTKIEGNPRGARIVAKNRPYSINTIVRYEGLYRVYIKDDPICKLPMQDVEESDALEYINRLARRNMTRKDLIDKYKMAGTETFEKIIKFFRMAFKEYQRQHHKWHNPFLDVEPPKATQNVDRDALTEDETHIIILRKWRTNLPWRRTERLAALESLLSTYPQNRSGALEGPEKRSLRRFREGAAGQERME